MAQTDLITVDLERCGAVASRLRAIPIPPASEEIDESSAFNVERLPNLYFLAVAICHQTSPVGEPRLGGMLRSGKTVFGWDYLRSRLRERLVEDESIADVHTWRKFTVNELLDALKPASGTAHINAPDRRVQLIRDCGDGMKINGWANVAELHASENGWLERGDSGILRRLSRFDAYRDPVRKKSYFLLELLRNECGWSYQDPRHLGAPVDYHEVRGHLRLGTVRVLDDALAKKLKQLTAVDAETDVAIRSAVATAINEIAARVGSADAPTLHYLFWNVFRSCCSRGATHCFSCGSGCSLPPRYKGNTVECPFAPACNSRGKPEFLEHQHETDFY